MIAGWESLSSSLDEGLRRLGTRASFLAADARALRAPCFFVIFFFVVAFVRPFFLTVPVFFDVVSFAFVFFFETPSFLTGFADFLVTTLVPDFFLVGSFLAEDLREEDLAVLLTFFFAVAEVFLRTLEILVLFLLLVVLAMRYYRNLTELT